MLKYTMLHTTGYQKLLYGKENITPYLKYNNQYVPSLRLSMAECSLLPGPGGNAEEQLLKTDSRPTVAVSRPTVYRACSLSTFFIYRPTVGRRSAKCWSW